MLEVAAQMQRLCERVAELEAENARLREAQVVRCNSRPSDETETSL